MIRLYIEQLAFILGLTALVLALLWTHVRPILRPIEKFWSNINDKADDLNKLKISNEHPRLEGHTLHKTATLGGAPRHSKYHIRPDGFSLSPHQVPGPQGFAQLDFDKGLHGYQRSQGSPLSMTVFTATIITLIIYVFMKLLSCKSRKAGELHTSSKEKIGLSPTGDLDGGHSPPRPLDRRKLQRMNREERARQLILHHGGKNVSRAIRFLVTELEKQKLHLFNQTNCQMQEQPREESEEETNVRVRCGCTCHSSAPLEEHSGAGNGLLIKDAD